MNEKSSPVTPDSPGYQCAVVAGGNVESVSCRTTERKVIVVQHPEVAVTGMALRLSRSGD